MSTYDLSAEQEESWSDAARFGQLTFTSYDGLGGAGWQVKDAMGLTNPEIEVLRAAIGVQLDAGVDLPRFPSPTDLERFPRRLVFDTDPSRAGEAAVAWWHHAPAGLDGSGRPGNVFAHVLLDRGPADSDSAWGGSRDDPGAPRGAPLDRRPIDWWRSPGWLTPYGPELVRDCPLPRAVPRPGPMISVERIAEFLLDFDDYRRLSVLRVLLDACAAALTGGRPIVLSTESTDKAALWIAAVGYLTSVATARCLSFSTLERTGSLENRLRQGVRLCCVPTQDHDRLAERNRGFVLIADDRDLLTGDLDGEPHRTAAGDEVVATEWSTLARVVLIDEPTARYALARITEIGSAAPAVADQPAWPLAMLVAAEPESFSDGVAAARRVVPNTPDGTSPAQLASARAFIERQQLSVDDAWEMIRSASRPGRPLGGMAEQALGVYVTLAVQDLDRLSHPGGPPLPESPWSGAGWMTESVHSAIAAALRQLGRPGDDRERSDPHGQDPERSDPHREDPGRSNPHGDHRHGDDVRIGDPRIPAAVLGLAVLTWRLGLLDHFAEDLADQAERLVWPVLAERGGPQLVAAFGPVHEEVLAATVRPSLPDGVRKRALGQALDLAVIRWLYPVPPTDAGRLDDRLRTEYAYQSWIADPEHHRADRVLALSAALLARRTTGFGLASDELAEQFGAPAWTIEELLTLEANAPGAMPIGFFGPAVKAGPAGGALNRLVDAVGRSRRTAFLARYGLGDLAELRRLSQRRWWLDSDLPSSIERLLAGGVAGLAYRGDLDADSVATLQVAILVAVALGGHLDEVEQLIDRKVVRLGLVRPGVADAVAEANTRGVGIGKLAAAAMIADPRFPGRSLQRPAYRWADQLTVLRDLRPMPVLHYCLTAQMARDEISIEQVDRAAKGRIWELMSGRGESGAQMYASTEKFTASWLRSVVPGEGWLRRWR